MTDFAPLYGPISLAKMSLLLSELVRLDGLVTVGSNATNSISTTDEFQVSFSVLESFAKSVSSESASSGGLYNAFVNLCGKGDLDLTVTAHDASLPNSDDLSQPPNRNSSHGYNVDVDQSHAPPSMLSPQSPTINSNYAVSAAAKRVQEDALRQEQKRQEKEQWEKEQADFRSQYDKERVAQQ